MLNKEEILRHTDRGLDVFKYYIQGKWRVGRNFLNPLYEDRKASCNIYYDRKHDCYRLKDFGNDAYSGDCFDTAGKILGLSCSNSSDFVEILKTVNRDLHLGLDENDTSIVVSMYPPPVKEKEIFHRQPELPKKTKPYAIVQQSFSLREIAFWQQYGITSEMLKTYKVVSLREFKSENNEGKPFTFFVSDTEYMFGYLGKRHVKIYRPFSDVRFMYGGNPGDNYCFGLEQLPAKGDTLFITGGEKDVLSLASKGFHAICFNSETSHIPQSVIKKLSYRFKHIVLLYDTDKTGLEASQKHLNLLSGSGVKRLVLPLSGTKEEKDISDYFKLGNSRENFIKLFIELLDTLYAETMSILKTCEVDFGNPPVKSEMLISINDVPLGTQGNLLGITGGEGTGKSNFVGSLIAGTISKASHVDTLGTVIQQNREDKAILLYDTEQSETQLYKNISSILKRGKVENMPGYFKAYCLTSMSRKERIQAIIESMDKYYYQYNGIQMVVIDGIADLVRCANDEAESIGVIDELYRLAGIYKTCIVCVLHFIPNGMKLRGHLGSELQRKSAAILSIERDEDPEISVVKALKVRDGSPLDVPLIQFAWDRELKMHTYIGDKPKEEKEKRKRLELMGVARTIFLKQRIYTYADLREQIQSILDVTERTSKSYIKFMLEKKIIMRDPAGSGNYIIGNI